VNVLAISSDRRYYLAKVVAVTAKVRESLRC
jgi:hypothetical protein